MDETMEQIKETTAVEQLPQIAFDQLPKEVAPTENATDKAQDLINSAFNQAVVHRVSTDEDVKQELLDSAEKVVHNKLDAIKARADAEDKEAYFNDKKNACDCFGYNETTTEKWAVSLMNIWHNIATAIWIVIGMLTFAPITFVCKKIKVIVKASWVAVLLAIIIYVVVCLTPLWLNLIQQWL